VRVFNENVPGGGDVPAFAHIKVLSPPDLAESTIATRETLRIAGAAPKTIYAEWLKWHDRR